MNVYISYAFAPVLAFTILLFLWNLIKAPPDMAREEIKGATAREATLRDENQVLTEIASS